MESKDIMLNKMHQKQKDKYFTFFIYIEEEEKKNLTNVG